MSAHQMPCRVKRNMYHSHVIRMIHKKCTSQENNTDAVRVLSVMVFGSYLRHFSFESVVLGSLVVWSGRPARLLSASVFGRLGCRVGLGTCLVDDSVLCVVKSSLVWLLVAMASDAACTESMFPVRPPAAGYLRRQTWRGSPEVKVAGVPAPEGFFAL